MPRKSTERPDDEVDDLVESMIIGVTEDGECVFIHNFEDDIRALEFLEMLTANLRSDILSGLVRRSVN